MAAPKGNKNALGNNGGRMSDKKTRKKISIFKGLVLDYVIKVMKRKEDDEEKKALVLKSITNILPRPIEVSGQDGEAIALGIITLPSKNANPKESKSGVAATAKTRDSVSKK